MPQPQRDWELTGRQFASEHWPHLAWHAGHLPSSSGYHTVQPSVLETRLDVFSFPWTALHATAPISDRLCVAVKHIYRHGI